MTALGRTDGELDQVVAGVLSARDEVRLAAAIEAGVLARAMLTEELTDELTEELTGESTWESTWESVGESSEPAAGRATRIELAELDRLGRVAFGLFVERNLALVGMVVRQECGPGPGQDADLFQEGCLALIEAVRRFDHRRGCRFATFALYGIRAQVRAARVRRDGSTTLSADRAGRARRAHALRARLSQDLGREASLADLAGALDRPVGWVGELLAHTSESSLDAVIGPQLVDRSAERAFETILDAAMPGAELLDALSPGQRAVLRLRFGFPPSRSVLSPAATAARLGISIRQVRRLELEALDALRGRCPQQARVHLAG